MAAQLHPNRMVLTDRFPMLGFTIRVGHAPCVAELVIATDPALFTRKDGRTSSTFYTSREDGLLAIPRGEAVYMVPPAVLARFVGAGRLWFGLATAASSDADAWTIDVLPNADSPYVSLSGLSDRGLRRVRVFPTRGGAAARSPLLNWAGDGTRPGATAVPAPAAPGAASAAPRPAVEPVAPHHDVHYDDGFGPLPPLNAATPVEAKPLAPAPAPAAHPAPATAPAPVSQGMSDDAEFRIAGDRRSFTWPRPRKLSTVERAALRAILSANPATASLMLLLPVAMRNGLSVSIGAGAGAGMESGASGAVGVIFDANGDDIGVFVSGELDFGYIVSASLTGQISLLRGHIDDFSGTGTTAGVMVGESAAGGISALFNARGEFVGVTLSAGVSVGSPVSIFVGVSRAAAGTIATSSSLAWSRALSDDPEAYGIDTPPYSDDDAGAEPPATASALALGARENSLVTRTAASPNFDEGRGSKTIDRIIIHIADVPTVQRVVNTFTNATSKVSAHYLVGQEGEVVQFVSEADTAWHCKGSNQRSIGIEHIAVKRGGADYPRRNGTVQHFDALAPTQLQYETSAALVASLCDKYQLPINRTTIMGHREADTSTGHTACPDGNWDWDYFMRLVTSRTCQPQAAGQALGLAARGLGDDIPLDPGVGGLSIGTDALEIGDIILSTTGNPGSGVIRAGSGAEVSHAMLYVGQGGQVIEAIPGGVQLRPLADALADARLAVAFRVPGLTDTQQRQVADAAARYLDRGFNYVGLVRCGSYLIDRRACDLLSGDAAERCRRFVGRIELGDGADTDNFFCSQLVAQSFQDAGRPIVTVPPHWVPPGDLASLSTGTMAPGTLAYVGHLKAPIPSRGFFGMSQALAVAPGAARALGADDWTVNWDDVQMTPQPTDMGCWATAASMVLGWRDNQSVDPALLARCISLERQMRDGLAPAEVAGFAAASTLTVEPNACFAPEGFRRLLEANGPIWVAEVVRAPVNFFHAVVVTGMYRSGDAYFVRITDPLDRVVGTPGHPGARTLPPTHATGSRYIMTYEDFVSEFEAAAGIGVIQLMHSGGTFGHTINRGSAAGAGYALGIEPPSAGGEFGLGVTLTRRTESRDGRSYDLAQLAGLVQPANALAGGAGQPRMAGQRITLDDWPYIDGPSGRTSAPVSIDWAWQGGAVGDVTIAAAQGQMLDGWTAFVRADIGRGSGTPERASVTLRITTTFRHAGEEEQVGVTEVVLNGDGRFQTVHGADGATPLPASGTQPAPREPQPA
ncbi:N-acetylmuramoyl-L-alanine amidase [Burkholderia sp. RF2-non_BP3]|uniref:N-acetylmuramoyl-L-alanine amidase n=1 Tax=Burkholderia sp. RF2-non_BP3 TaxID=1637844 RepID=UPI000A918B53|nr:N-acetylmuramoyl-L-alanine amidase [Burkholderia sp. RF2-non_BP3]